MLRRLNHRSVRLEQFGEALDLAAAGINQLALAIGTAHRGFFATSAAMHAFAEGTLVQALDSLGALERTAARERPAPVEGLPPCYGCGHTFEEHSFERGLLCTVEVPTKGGASLTRCPCERFR